MKIKIKDKEIELKYTIRALFVFEKIAGKPFSTTSITDLYLLFYSVIIANDNTIQLTFDELVNMCDEDATLFSSFADWLTKQFQIQNQFIEEDNKKKESK